MSNHDFEITKHVTLCQFDLFALVMLRRTSKAQSSLLDRMYDLRFSDRYKWGIKTVMASVTCIHGPFTNFEAFCLLTTARFHILTNTSLEYGEDVIRDARPHTDKSSSTADFRERQAE